MTKKKAYYSNDQFRVTALDYHIKSYYQPHCYFSQMVFANLSYCSYLCLSQLRILENKNMKKKICLITGATSGIGEACARKFAQGGFDLILTGRREEKLNLLAQELKEKGVNVLPLVFDVRNHEEAKKAIDQLPEEWTAIDILINNAGLARGLEPLQEGSLDDWNEMIDTNIKGLLTMTRLIVPGMVARNHGHIINIGSVAGDAAYAGGNVYCATKSAVKAISDGLRIDVSDTAVRVTNVKPGLVQTHFSNVRFHGDDARADKVYEGIQPLTGDDIADVCLYAASAPEHVQVAEVLVLATHQANGTVIKRDLNRDEHLS